MLYTYCDSPVGRLLLAGTREAIATIGFEAGSRAFRHHEAWTEDAGAFAEPVRQLREYFEGMRRTFDLPLAPHGTPFQLRVWQALLGIPYGETISYAELARRTGSVARAVGQANGANPLPIVVPCHRVVGANGSLTGFGGGIEIKRRLLDLERGTPRLALE